MEIPDANATEASELFDREWAMAVMNRALAALVQEQGSRQPPFEVIHPWLMGDAVGSQAQTAAQLGISEGAFKVAVHRLRKRFRDHLRHEVQQTLDDDADVDEELRYLSSVLR
jgi:RNA polymerase sigma-70 factor (ECF subfamily)